MGSFSWLKADDLTQIANVAEGHPFKFLIPMKFGGGFIRDDYRNYGDLGHKGKATKYDMYELLAFWNADKLRPGALQYEGDTMPLMKEIDEHTSHNRILGIEIGCYNDQIDRLKYPLKLVSASFSGRYEDLDRPSYGDPNQGFFPTKRKRK